MERVFFIKTNQIIRNAEFLRVGSFTKVKIVEANYYDLFAEII